MIGSRMCNDGFVKNANACVTNTASTGLMLVCRHYHANLGPDEREHVQREWSLDRVQVIVATIAFGMGDYVAFLYILLYVGMLSFHFLSVSQLS
jgi:superfamily II helicase